MKEITLCFLYAPLFFSLPRMSEASDALKFVFPLIDIRTGLLIAVRTGLLIAVRTGLLIAVRTGLLIAVRTGQAEPFGSSLFKFSWFIPCHADIINPECADSNADF